MCGLQSFVVKPVLNFSNAGKQVQQLYVAQYLVKKTYRVKVMELFSRHEPTKM